MRPIFQSASGFTLIELIAVISILGMMLFFAIPRLDNGRASGDLKSATRWILIKVADLKEKAINEQKPYALVVSFAENSFTVLDNASLDDDIDAQQPQAHQLPNGVTVSDVEFPDKGVVTGESAEIVFYPKGYSSKALIHLSDMSGDTCSILIEPFLPSAKLYETYKSFFSL